MFQFHVRAGLAFLVLGAIASSQEARTAHRAGDARAAQGTQAAQGNDLREELGRVLAAFDPEEASPRKVAAAVAGLGPDVAPYLLKVLADGHVPALPAPRQGQLEADTSTILGRARREGCLIATQRLGRTTFVTILEELAGQGTAWPLRRAGVQVLARVGRGRDLELAVRLLEIAPKEESIASEVARTLEGTAKALFLREQSTFQTARGLCLNESQGIALSLSRAAGAVPSWTSLQFLADLLGSRAELDIALLSQIERVVRALPTPDNAIRAQVRGYLWNDNSQIVRKAAQVIARCEDFAAMPRLIELLGTGDRIHQEGALWALQELSGIALSAKAERWSAWYEREDTWYQTRAKDLYDVLEGGTDAEVYAALIELGSHHYRGDESSRRAAFLLDHETFEIRSVTCLTLRRLESRAALPELIEALDDTDEEIAALAWESLCSITGLELPPESAAWEKEVRLN